MSRCNSPAVYRQYQKGRHSFFLMGIKLAGRKHYSTYHFVAALGDGKGDGQLGSQHNVLNSNDMERMLHMGQADACHTRSGKSDTITPP
ncbi:hypothetical protein AVEN_47646-1 [Araneus ventricosus]|uniref:Uncharacterized protein n=1 Tax=Araneus ventricosus TaxID=182803 RepID=A0A4Y2T9F6_ARAVE|nr:hypothetical protein AVEN_47646-1 [Araneus ventricosus]